MNSKSGWNTTFLLEDTYEKARESPSTRKKGRNDRVIIGKGEHRKAKEEGGTKMQGAS